jgi:hypothetical protein
MSAEFFTAKSVVLDVEACLNVVLAVRGEHGKSPCFSDVDFLSVGTPDWAMCILGGFDGADCLE